MVKFQLWAFCSFGAIARQKTALSPTHSISSYNMPRPSECIEETQEVSTLHSVANAHSRHTKAVF